MEEVWTGARELERGSPDSRVGNAQVFEGRRKGFEGG